MFTLRFEGGAEIARNLRELSVPVSRRLLREALKEAGEPMARHMSLMAPYDPTSRVHLRDNIGIGNATSDDPQITSVAVGPTTKGFYGSFQELGTSEHAAQPFARPAFDATVIRVLKLFADAMWRLIAAKGGYRRVSLPTAVIPGPTGSLVPGVRGRGRGARGGGPGGLL